MQHKSFSCCKKLFCNVIIVVFHPVFQLLIMHSQPSFANLLQANVFHYLNPPPQLHLKNFPIGRRRFSFSLGAKTTKKTKKRKRFESHTSHDSLSIPIKAMKLLNNATIIIHVFRYATLNCLCTKLLPIFPSCLPPPLPTKFLLYLMPSKSMIPLSYYYVGVIIIIF